MKIAIIGYGIEGRAAYEYWRDGNEITICDQKANLDLPEGVSAQLGDDYLTGLEGFDLIVRSPFVHPDKLIEASSADIIPRITSNTNEFMRASPGRNIIGITGTKGKGTTSTLVTRMLEATGKTMHLGGNIGVPALQMLQAGIQSDDWVVLELSSYQLIDIKQSPPYAACLTVMPEHLDWHQDMAEYIGAKQQLFRWQSPEDYTVFYAGNELSQQITSVSVGQKIPYLQSPGAVVENDVITIDGQAICRTDELKLLGKHNWQNVCAAVTLCWQITQDTEAMRSVLTSFAGLPFRIELRKEVAGVRYYNDSYASMPGSSIAAMQAINGPKVMIMGGFDRGLDLQDLISTVIDQGDNVRHALLIGASKERLAQELKANGFTNFVVSQATTMPEIVGQAKDMAQSGDAVVLSPGFASFGLFENFEDRGRKFNAAVEAL